MAQNYTFNKYQSIYDNNIILYGLEKDGVEVTIDNVKYIEVSPDFKRVYKVRADSVKVVGKIVKEF
jgi:hypothetical protein